MQKHYNLKIFVCISALVRIFKVLIKVSGDHSVIELSYLVCAHSVEALKALVRGDDVDLPW